MEEKLPMANGSKIRELRINAGMTQEKLGAMSNLDRRTVQRAEKSAKLQMETLSSIASALNVPLQQIVSYDVPQEDIDELKAKSLVVLRRVQSGMALLNTVRDSFEGSISCEVDPTTENIDMLVAVVSKIEELMPDPWLRPRERISFPLSERLRTAVILGDHLKQLESTGIALFAGTYTARTQVPLYDPDEGEMYVTSRTPYELVTICRLLVAPVNRGDRISIKAPDMYIQPQTPPADAKEDEDDEIPF